MDVDFADIRGAADLVAWFGYWPMFHDAEVLSLHLNRKGDSRIRLHTWEITREIDSNGFYILRKHVIVTFVLSQIDGLALTGFNYQNVIFELSLTKEQDKYVLELDPTYGIGGTISAGTVVIELEPGEPPALI